MAKRGQKQEIQTPEDVIVDGYVQDAGELVDPKDIKVKKNVLSKIPAWLKVYFINFWFGGAVCYFVVGGIFDMVGYWGSVLVLGLVYGLAGDILLNNVLKAIIAETEQFKRSVFFHSKSFISIIVNCLYGIVCALLIVLFYWGVNILIEQTGGKGFFGVEPLTVGIVYATLCLGFISAKNLVVWLFKRAKSGGVS